MKRLALVALSLLILTTSTHAETVPLWPDLAPGETTKKTGTTLPMRPEDNPPITRAENITAPTLTLFPAPNATGVGVLILPGGGFGKIVPDMEGSEAATWLNTLGISAFVLNYRTTTGVDPSAEAAAKAEPWKRPLQDTQRAMRHLRHHAAEYRLDPNMIGLLGFSAGGQVAAIHLTSEEAAYEPNDAIDTIHPRPDFSLLIYPWKVADEAKGQLISQIKPSAKMPPGFIVHTDDDKSSSLGAALIYLGMKQHGVSGELHVYQNGGHGYGTRERPDSVIGTWKDRATDWLRVRGLAGEIKP